MCSHFSLETGNHLGRRRSLCQDRTGPISPPPLGTGKPARHAFIKRTSNRSMRGASLRASAATSPPFIARSRIRNHISILTIRSIRIASGQSSVSSSAREPWNVLGQISRGYTSSMIDHSSGRRVVAMRFPRLLYRSTAGTYPPDLLGSTRITRWPPSARRALQ